METVKKMTVRGIADLLMNNCLSPTAIVGAIIDGNENPVKLSNTEFDCDIERNITGMIQQFGDRVRITSTFSDGVTKCELNVNNSTTVTRYFRDLTIAEYEVLCRLAQYISTDLA